MGIFNSLTHPRVNRILKKQLVGDVLNLVAYHLRKLNEQLAQFTTERQPALWPVVAFSKNQL